MNKEEKLVHDLLPVKKEVVVSPKGSKVDPTKEDEELVKKDVEEKTRVEEPKPKVKEERKIEVTNEEFMSFAALSGKLIRMERMLEYLIIAQVTDNQKILPEPNIRDILKEISAGRKITVKEKKDEVPADS